MADYEKQFLNCMGELFRCIHCDNGCLKEKVSWIRTKTKRLFSRQGYVLGNTAGRSILSLVDTEFFERLVTEKLRDIVRC